MERKGLSSSRERNRKVKNDREIRGGGEVERLIMPGRWPVGSYKEQGREERRKIYGGKFGSKTED